MPIRTVVYIFGASICAILANGALFLIAPHALPEELRATIWMASIGLFAQVMTHRLPKGSASIAFIPFLAAAIITPSWIVGVAAGLSILIAEFVHRRSPLKALFNVSQVTFSIATALLLYRLVGGVSLLNSALPKLLVGAVEYAIPVFALISSFFWLNSLLVAGVIAVSEQGNVFYIWRKNTFAAIPYDLLSAPIVFLFAWVYADSGAIGAVALCLPLVGIRQLYKTNSELELVNQELLELMVKAIEARDPYTSGHSRRVAHYSQLIARAIGLSGQQVERVRIAALLHDVGKSTKFSHHCYKSLTSLRLRNGKLCRGIR